MDQQSAPGPDPHPGWVRGALELAVIAVLTEGDRHGYALAQRLADHGFGTVRGGALYPVLGRLEAQGSVRSGWQPGEGGPGRKVYSITEAGRAKLTSDRLRWREFSAVLGHLLEACQDAAPEHPRRPGPPPPARTTVEETT